MLPQVVAAGEAPLDTLRAGLTPDEANVVDPRYLGSNIDISRKLLPDVQATSIPSAESPRTPPRSDDPLGGRWRFGRALQAAAIGDAQSAETELDAALIAAPGTPRYLLWQLMRAISRGNVVIPVATVPSYLRSLSQHPLIVLRMTIMVHQTAVLLAGIFWTLLVLAIWLVKWRFLAHDLSALLLRDRRHTPLITLPILLPLVLILLRPGWLGFLALMSLPLFLLVRGKTRGLLAFVWLGTTLLVTPVWTGLQTATVAIDPESEAVLLDEACIMPASAGLNARLRNALDEAQDPLRKQRLQVALAIQEARRGAYRQSSRIFEDVLQGAPDVYPALVGLANNTYYLGRLDTAVELYRKAASLHPDRGAVHYNLAQAYFKKLFVPEAADALQEARRLGFAVAEAGLAPTKQNTYASVVYPGLTAETMWQACRYEADNYAPLTDLAAWSQLLGCAPLPHYLVLGVPFLLALALRRWLPHQKDPRACENCGVPLCRSCCRVRDAAWLCPICGETADRSRSNMILATLLKNRSLNEGLASSHRLVRLGRIFPGAGHLAIGQPGGALLRLGILAVGWFCITAGWAFDPVALWNTPGVILLSEAVNPLWLPLPEARWLGWSSPSVVLGLSLVVLMHLLALWDGSRLRDKIPERFSLVPVDTGSNRPTTAAAGSRPGGSTPAVGRRAERPRQTVGAP